MRTSALAFVTVGFLASIAAAAAVANYAVTKIEETSERTVKSALVASGQNWAVVETDGTWIRLTGTAPDEQKRIQALSAVSAVVSTARIQNVMEVEESIPAIAPDFALEILRSGSDVSLIGITPVEEETDIIRSTIDEIDGVALIDMKETTNWDAPVGWQPALEFGADIMSQMDRAKISIEPGSVSLIAVVKNEEEKEALIVTLAEAQPDGVELELDITAPRSIFSPYNLIFTIAEGATLRCHTLTPEGVTAILTVAREAGVSTTTDCDIGLGAPTDNWSEVAISGMNTVIEMGAGQLDMRDSEITLTAPEDFSEDQFNALATKLRESLPVAYMLNTVRPVRQVETGADDRPYFEAMLPAEGLILLTGVVIDDISQQTISTYSEAQFGYEQINDKTRIAEFAPHGWTAKQLVAIDVLALLNEGKITVTEDTVTVTGKGQVEGLQDVIQASLENGFGADARFSINVEELAPPEIIPDFPDATECEDEIAAILAETQISFAPSSAVIEAGSEPIVTQIAQILNRCSHAAFEVEGHTDSQGREEMNKNLSQNRANAVVDALLARSLLLGALSAVGYGEAQPIADNETEEGRQENRRIAFKLLVESDVVETVAETTEEAADEVVDETTEEETDGTD